jgi:hypothetical protein
MFSMEFMDSRDLRGVARGHALLEGGLDALRQVTPLISGFLMRFSRAKMARLGSFMQRTRCQQVRDLLRGDGSVAE